MKKLAILLLLPTLLLAQSRVCPSDNSEIWNGNHDIAWYQGNETETAYTICTAEELAGLAQLVNNTAGLGSAVSFQSKTITLGANIALNDTNGWESWDKSASAITWTAIGTVANPFMGIFDGNVYTISGVYINASANDQGLFGVVGTGGTVANAGILASFIRGNNNVGGIAGTNNGTIANSYFVGAVSVGTLDGYSGGVVGRNGGTIANSYSTATMKASGTFMDSRDDQIYKWVRIGSQVWMAENLNYNATNSACYQNYASNCNTYGRLYNWATAMSLDASCNSSYCGADWVPDWTVPDRAEPVNQGVCPDGWHLPRNYDWRTLRNFVGTDPGTKLKATSGWNNNGNGTDDHGFSALPGGFGYPIGDGVYYSSNSFLFAGDCGHWWSTWEADATSAVYMHYRSIEVFGCRDSYSLDEYRYDKSDLYSVRCLRDIGEVGVQAVGGVAGNNSGTVANSYWNTAAYNGGGIGGGSGTANATGRIEADMKNAAFATLLNNNRESLPNIPNVSYRCWDIIADINQGYPIMPVKCPNNLITFSIEDWIYNENPKIPAYYPSLERDPSPNAPAYSYTGASNSNVSYNSATPPTEAGSYTLTATFPESNNYDSFTKTADFKINRAEGSCAVNLPNFTASGTRPNPESTTTNDVNQVSYLYKSVNDSSYPQTSQMPANEGEYEIKATFPQVENYNECVATNTFTIYRGDANFAEVTWEPSCDTAFTYNGQIQNPMPYSKDYALNVIGRQINAGSHTATAQLAVPDNNVILQNATCAYTIEPKTLQVSWTADSVFTYNKMVQAPMPSVSEPGVKLLRSNTQSAAGTYRNEDAAIAEIEDQAQARNYNLANRTKGYEILKKDLAPYFAASMPTFETNAGKDTLWVPAEVFSDTTSLRKILSHVMDYDGFAKDTVSNESDNAANSLKGTPEIKLSYDYSPLLAPHSLLFRRSETTQKATAIISTEGVSADNYLVGTRQIVIMEAIYDDEANIVYCYRGSYCTELNEEVCAFIEGETVTSCSALTTSCLIDDRCVNGMLLASCQEIGGEAVETCEATPIVRVKNFSPQQSAPLYYNLKGEPLGTAKPTAPGVYIEKHGKYTRKIVLK